MRSRICLVDTIDDRTLRSAVSVASNVERPTIEQFFCYNKSRAPINFVRPIE